MRAVSPAFFAYLFLIYIHQNDVSANLDNTAPGNEKFKVPAEKPADFARPWNDKRLYTSGFAVDFQIADTAQRTAGTHVDDFLLLQIIKAHR